ncbi:hypothetical protein BDW59DRAFT_180455 [Aspergillus cavernicola]|uniref:FAD/NAD(P)-binding domain-containing protein n=1 Tax=Aspergillus cavernicola TaxID=176166 RepID=A0ABR4I7Q0_9EURO
MPKLVVVGAGFHGLIAARTYLQLSDNDILIIDSASDIGGTWARERLYPNLLSQNSYDHYEFGDLPLATAVPDHPSEANDDQRIRLNWKVEHISRLPSRQWTLQIVAQTGSVTTPFTVMCDKLVLATGLTSEPNIPDIPQIGDHPIPAIHARDVGQFCRENLGYQPIPSPRQYLKCGAQHYSFPRSVVIYGGAKSAFDFIHLFRSLHRNSGSLDLEAHPLLPVQVHWIIREDGHGPAWMTQPTTRLGRKQVSSDQAVCTRMVGMLGRCVHEVPKRVVLLHENPVGRLLIHQAWKQVDATIHASANYDSQPKMEKLRPAASVIECTSLGGIANHPDLWDTIRGPNVHIRRSSIVQFSGVSPELRIDLMDGTHIPSVDLIVHATGWKLSIPIPFDPPTLGAHLGLPCSSISAQAYDWAPLEQKAESKMRYIFDFSIFKNGTPPTSNAYRLFRRVAAPSLIAEGDRSFAIMGAVYTGNVTVVAEVQALWVAAFLTGGLDHDDHKGPLASSQRVYETVADDVVWGRLTGAGLSVDTFKYNDMLMNDLGLDPYREGGRWWKELMAVYAPSSYAGIVEEWVALRKCGENKIG